jgi:hypothetical protein
MVIPTRFRITSAAKTIRIELDIVNSAAADRPAFLTLARKAWKCNPR